MQARKFGTCDLSASTLMLVFFLLSRYEATELWKLIVCLIAWVCAIILNDDP